MNEDEATRLFARTAEDIPPVPRPPITHLIRGGQGIRRRQRLLRVGGIAAVAALIIGAGALWLPGSSGSAQPATATNETTAPDDSGLPTAPDGTRWVGFNGVMVAVPEAWSANPPACEEDTAPSAMVIGERSLKPCVGLMAFSLAGPAPTNPGDETVDLDGTPAVRDSGYCVYSLPGQCEGSLYVPSERAAFTVMALDDMDLIDAILDTARLVPDGHTSVPDVSGLVHDSDVAPLMNQADLVWTPRCPPETTCDMGHLEATDPATGSVVPVGTTVTAADAPQRTNVTPPVTAADLDGNWAATMRFGQELQEEGPVLTFTASQQWSGTEGCNVLMGEYSVEADGSFEARATVSTGRGCSGNQDDVSNVDVVTAAEYVSLENDVLAFMSGDGEVIGEYRPVTASLVTVPHVVGLREKKAKQALTEVGLTSSVEGPASDDFPTAPVVVAEQSPEAGQRVEHGSSVTLLMAESVLQQVTLTLFHCGINEVKFEGLFWERPWKDGPNITADVAPPGWVGTGTMLRIDKDEAIYVDASGREVPFRPAEDVRNHVCY